MIFKRHTNCNEVVEGGIYQHHFSDSTAERARVIWIGEDPAGIPHVRYEVSYVHPGKADPQGTRMLSLKTFRDHYRWLDGPDYSAA